MALRLGHYKMHAIQLRDVVYRQEWNTNGGTVSLPVRYLWNSRSSVPDASLAASSQRVHASLSAALQLGQEAFPNILSYASGGQK